MSDMKNTMDGNRAYQTSQKKKISKSDISDLWENFTWLMYNSAKKQKEGTETILEKAMAKNCLQSKETIIPQM